MVTVHYGVITDVNQLDLMRSGLEDLKIMGIFFFFLFFFLFLRGRLAPNNGFFSSTMYSDFIKK